MEFALGMLSGVVLGGWVCWTIFTKELNELKELLQETLVQLGGYINLKRRIK